MHLCSVVFISPISQTKGLCSVTFAKADASSTGDIRDDGWEEGSIKEQADVPVATAQVREPRNWEGMFKSSLKPWGLAVSALTSSPCLVLAIPKSLFGTRNGIFLG